jgi:anaerobic magnesium-protoporphyrin IX monomethyl ester cyclase
MRIGLVYPNEGKKEKAIHLGLAYIASYARTQHADLNFEMLDTRIATKREKQKFLATNFELIGITLMSGVYKQAIEIAKEIRKMNPSAVICVGGPYVSSLEKEILSFTEFDLAVFGEGEITFSEIISSMKGEKELASIDGLIFRNTDGISIMNKARAIKNTIESLPLPAYDLFKMNRYPNYRILTSRGCPYKCSFCSSADVWQFKWQKRKPQSIIDEIKFLIEHYGRKTFFFNDDTFNMSSQRAEDICDLLISNDLKILWTTPFRADRVDEKLAVKMKLAGCYNVAIGIESADNGLLALMDKQITIEQITEGIKILRNAGIEVLGQFVIGIPGETPQTFEKTLQYALNSELDFVLFYSSLPYKRTVQWDFVEKHGKFLHTSMHEYHDIKPRVVFETKEFQYQDRVEAIKKAEKAGFYVDDNRLSHVFDFGRTAAKYFQQYLPAVIGNAIYLGMKKIYRENLKGKILKN